MTIVKVTDELRSRLKKSTFSVGILDNCLNSKFIAIKEVNSKIVGVCFVGGVFNNQGIEILEEFRGKGLSKVLLDEMVEECKKRDISFLTTAFKPSNLPSIKAHMKIGYRVVFTFYYNQFEKKEIVVIRPFNKKGIIFLNFARVFNTHIGNLIFSIILKLSNPILKNVLAFSGDRIPKVDFFKSVKNFEKVQETLRKENLENDITMTKKK